MLLVKRPTLIIVLANIIAVSACSSLPQHQQPATIANQESSGNLLNSERIRQKFGSYGIDVLQQNEQQRVSSLYSLQWGKKITRTLAVVSYPDSIAPAMLKEHEQIQSGQSIGEVFKNNGWQIEKQPVYIEEIESSPEYDGVYAMMGGIEEVNLALNIYQLIVSKDGDQYNYVLIAEIHHPDYLNITALRQIHQLDTIAPRWNQESVQASLDQVTGVMKRLR